MPLAITFDWFGTLAEHRNGLGRGRQFHAYLTSKGLTPAPWDRRILYDLFEYYADAYQPGASPIEKHSFWVEFTRRLFKKAHVGCPPAEIHVHGNAIGSIFGSSCFQLFADVTPTLGLLKQQGIRLGLISNWQRGLQQFCEELGVASYFDVIISSAEVKSEKPDPRIFQEALARLDVSAECALHVGDSVDEDVLGASSVGMRATLLDRGRMHSSFDVIKIHDLHELERVLTSGRKQ